MRKQESTKKAARLDRDVLIKILLALKGYRLLLVLSLVLALVSVAAGLYVPILIGRAIDLIAGKGHEKYQEICGQKFPMDDRQLAMKCKVW